MIDRKTAIMSAALIALMLMAAACRISILDDWSTLPVQNGAPLPSLLLFFFPACSVLVVGALYWDGRGATADDTKLHPWRNWGKVPLDRLLRRPTIASGGAHRRKPRPRHTFRPLSD